MRPSPVLRTRQCRLTHESIWAIWSWGFATLKSNTEALGPRLLLLLPFSPPVGTGARWARFPYLYLVLPSVSQCRPAPVPLPPRLVPRLHAAGGQAQLSAFCARGKPSLSAQDVLQPSSSCCHSSSSIRSLCTSSPQAEHPWGLPTDLLESGREMQQLFRGNDCERINSIVQVCVCRNPS